MKQKTLDAIRAHAEAEYPKECCGLVLAVKRKEVYFPCSNTAQGTDHFVIGADDYAEAEDTGRVVMVVHSHPDHSAEPSEADRVSCEASGLPWLIVSVMAGAAGEIREFQPSGYEAPLIGRPFQHGVLDCYTIIRDFHQRELGNDLPNHERADDWWDDGHSNLYLNNYEADGWVALPEGAPLTIGDMVLMQIQSKNGVPNHAGVISGFRDGRPEMIHHLHGYRSERVVYGGYYGDATRLIVRHKGIL